MTQSHAHESHMGACLCPTYPCSRSDRETRGAYYWVTDTRFNEPTGPRTCASSRAWLRFNFASPREQFAMGVDSDYFQFLRYPSLAFGASSSARSPRCLSDDQPEVASLKQMGDRPASLVEFLRQRTGGNGMSHSVGDDTSRSDGSRRFGAPHWQSEPDDGSSSVASSGQDQQNIVMHGDATPTANAAAAVAIDGKANSKRSRYLRESDRRNIIRRIGYGEKQATLAKEYGVTRAAICHINKNRMEIMTRSTRADVHSAARHPKRGLYNTSPKPM